MPIGYKFYNFCGNIIYVTKYIEAHPQGFFGNQWILESEYVKLSKILTVTLKLSQKMSESFTILRSLMCAMEMEILLPQLTASCTIIQGRDHMKTQKSVM